MELDKNGMPVAPGTRPAGLMKSKVGGAFIALIGFGMAYFFLLKPLQEANRTGHLVYYLKAIVFAPALVYAGIVVMLGDFRDGQISVVGPDGKKRFTTKGKWFMGGLVLVMVLTVAGWEWYLHSIGFTSDF